MKSSDETATYAQMGIAALLPGMAHMIELMQRQLDEMRAQLTGLQQPPRKKLGRPPKSLNEMRTAAAKTGWPTDPEERSKEMKRRQAVTRAKLTGKLPVTDPRNPKHEAWLKKTKAAAKKRWDGMTVKERKAKVAALAAGRAKKRVDSALAEAS